MQIKSKQIKPVIKENNIKVQSLYAYSRKHTCKSISTNQLNYNYWQPIYIDECDNGKVICSVKEINFGCDEQIIRRRYHIQISSQSTNQTLNSHYIL